MIVKPLTKRERLRHARAKPSESVVAIGRPSTRTRYVRGGSIEAADAFARAAFGSMLDRSGEPPILHARRVAARLTDGTRVEKAAALCHDVIEDTAATCADLRRGGVHSDAIEVVFILTRATGEVYRAYIGRIIDSGNVSAMRVKLADLYDNMSPSRLGRLPEKERGIVLRYQWAASRIRAALTEEQRAGIVEGELE